MFVENILELQIEIWPMSVTYHAIIYVSAFYMYDTLLGGMWDTRFVRQNNLKWTLPNKDISW